MHWCTFLLNSWCCANFARFAWFVIHGLQHFELQTRGLWFVEYCSVCRNYKPDRSFCSTKNAVSIGDSTNGAEIAVCFAFPNVRKHRPQIFASVERFASGGSGISASLPYCALLYPVGKSQFLISQIVNHESYTTHYVKQRQELPTKKCFLIVKCQVSRSKN